MDLTLYRTALEQEVRALLAEPNAWSLFRPEATDKWYQCAVYNSRAESPWGAFVPTCLKVAQELPGKHLRWASLSRLDPAGVIPRHRDGERRPSTLYYHVPIMTNDGCVFLEWTRHGHINAFGDLRDIAIEVDYSRDHMAVNGGSAPRVHLLVMKVDSDDPEYLASVRV